MIIFKSAPTLQLQPAGEIGEKDKDINNVYENATAIDSNLPNQIFIHEQHDNSHTDMIFGKLFSCWGSGLAFDDCARSEADRKNAVEEAAKAAATAEMTKLKEAQEAKEAAIARRKQIQEAQVKKAAAV